MQAGGVGCYVDCDSHLVVFVTWSRQCSSATRNVTTRYRRWTKTGCGQAEYQPSVTASRGVDHRTPKGSTFGRDAPSASNQTRKNEATATSGQRGADPTNVPTTTATGRNGWIPRRPRHRDGGCPAATLTPILTIDGRIVKTGYRTTATRRRVSSSGGFGRTRGGGLSSYSTRLKLGPNCAVASPSVTFC